MDALFNLAAGFQIAMSPYNLVIAAAGVVLGVITPIVVSELSQMRTIITPLSVLLAFGISGAVGIIFGLYPASRAAQLDPILAGSE